jgi:large subunit ribosomal protein L15
MRLNEISDVAGARRERTRVGRGMGSGKGKTAGRGHKGQKSRSGVAIKGFEGGQMPLHRRLPKRGFSNPTRRRYAEVTLAKLQAAVDKKTLDPSAPITEAVLKEAGVVTHLREGVRVLGGGDLKAKLNLDVSGATGPAIAAVKAAGGSVTIPERKPKHAKRRDKVAAKRSGAPAETGKAAPAADDTGSNTEAADGGESGTEKTD